MNLVDVLNAIWSQILQVTSMFVIPDWGQVIAALPVVVVVGLVGPFLTFLALGTVIYLVRKPRVRVRFEEGPRVAEIGADGRPTFPVGLPYCRRDGLVYPPGTLRCERCHDELAVVCPMCSLGRSALIDTCANCGLVLKVKSRAVAVRASTGPKPGGAAVA
ncbi:MAG TPA: hypothetical protein VF494_00400 [Candidatus Limnocylindrales bacterium]